MRKHLFKYFRQFVAFLVVCSMLIASAPIDSYAAQDMAGDEKEKVYVADGYTVTFTLDTVWNSGYNVSVVIQNTGSETISDWYMYLKYNVDISNMWNASVYETSFPYMVLTNAGWNKDVYSNGTAGFGYTGSGEFPGFPESVKVTSGYDPTAMEGGSDDHGDDGGDTPDDGADTDGDGLTDTFEETIGSDPELVDTDGDGLSDYQEVYLTLTDPTVKDTDGDGVLDPNEDIDEDGLGNLDELTGGTDPGNPDTDRDDLNDYDEIHVYGCDPLNYDSDGDGLCDGDDVLLGFSPTMSDTDLNGILDSAEKVYQTTENDFAFEDAHGLTSVSVSLNVSGNIDKEIEITNVYEFDSQSREVVGLIGAPIEITCDAPFETATISFSYDESALGDTSEENLSLMWYDEENNWYQILDQDCVVDPVNNTVSYTTTHFSEYNLVDRLLWFNTWNEDIDYPEEEQTELTYHPTRYIVIEDVSSFQSTEDTELIEEIKNTLSDCAYRFKLSKEGRVLMQNGLGKTWDLTGMFDNATREYFTSDGYTITPGDEADHLWSPTYRRPNLTSILSSIVYGYDTYPEYYSTEGLVIFYISNQSSGAGEEILQACAERGIKIYTIDIRNDEEDSILKNISDITNGNHYCGEITHDPVLLVNSLVYVMNGFTSYGSDRDKDGLLDKYEIYGVKTIAGIVFKTDPDKKDTDDDKLSDYDELGMVYDLNLYIGFGVFKNCRFVIPRSDPNNPDTDGDGITDDVDAYPYRKEIEEVLISNIYSFEFLEIGDFDSGDQRWWMEDEEFKMLKAKNSFHYFNTLIDYRTRYGACGLIAMTDLELYLAQQNGYQSSPVQDIPLYGSDGKISVSDYMAYANCNRDNVYHLNGGLIDYNLGVNVVWLVLGLTDYLAYNGAEYIYVKWAGCSNADQIIYEVKRMINQNYPVVCSYHSRSDEPLFYYSTAYDAMNLTDYNKELMATSHYFTIIGYVRYYDDDGRVKYLLKTASNGGIYYVNFDAYSRNVNITNNILEYEFK